MYIYNMKLLIALLIFALPATAQTKQTLVDHGWAIASDGDTVTTQPRVIYSNGGGFVVNVRIMATNDTTWGEYAITRHQYTQGKFEWVAISDTRRCKMTWPVVREIAAELNKRRNLAVN